MTTAVQRRRGTNTEHATFTGLDGEITVNTTTYTLHVHDGATVGGVALAKADGSNLVTSSIDINGGTIDGTVIGGSSAAAGTFTSITGTSANINGTVTADGLTVGNGTQQIRTYVDADEVSQLIDANVRYDLWTGGSKTMRLDANGDISFYEDTGTTAKFFWDASAESLGIGTTSPWETLSIPFNEKLSFGSSTYPFSISRSSAGQLVTTFEDGYASGNARIDFKMANGSVTPLSLLGSGRVGIGTTNPFYKLVVSAGGASGIEFGPAYSGTANLVQHYSRSGGVYVDAVNDAAQHRFNISGSERARIDSSGNLLVGKTTADNTTQGNYFQASDGFNSMVSTNNTTLLLNRKTSDGDIALFRKDGTTVGSIGTNSNTIYIDGSSANTGIQFAGSAWVPRDSGAFADNTVDVGTSTYRLKDLYLSGGVYLGGTGAANLLDDYETGTFTPTAGSNITSFTVQSAHYEKIGDIVHAQMYLSSVISTSGEVQIEGLPFTNSTLYGSAALHYASSGGIPYGGNGYVEVSNTKIILSTGAVVSGAAWMIVATYRAA